MGQINVNAIKSRPVGLPAAMKSASLLLGLILLSGGGHAATSVTRVDAFDYETATGLPSKRIVEPGDSNLCSSTAYGYDSYGNTQQVTVSNCAGLAGNYLGSSASTNTEAAAPGAGSSAPFVQRPSTINTTYNTDGTVTVVSTNAQNESETRVYGGAFGQLLSLKGPNNLTTQWTYDGFGRKTLEARADGTGTTWTYKYCSGVNGGQETCPVTLNTGHATLQVTAYPAYVMTEQPVLVNTTTLAVGATNGAYTKVYYDALNRPIRTETQGFDKSKDGLTNIQTVIYQDTTYDNLGRVATTSRPYYSTDAAYVTRTQYDNWGRAILVTAADGSTTSTTYNGLDTTVQNALNQVTIQTRNVVGQIEQIKDNNNKTLLLAYDAFGNLTQSTDSAGNVVKMQYDARGRKYAMQDPDMGSWTYAYNAVGNMVKQTDAKSQITTQQYDKVDRLIAKIEPNLNTNWYYGTYADGATACPTGKGKLCEATANNGYDRKYTYDSVGRQSTVVTKVDITTYTQTWSYDTNGRLLSVSYPSTVTATTSPTSFTPTLVVQNMYTPLGYLWKLVDNVASPTQAYWKAQARDAEAHLLEQSYGNQVVTDSTYDPATGRLNTTVAKNVNNVVQQNIAYSYDSLGSLKTRNDSVTGVNASYGYDGINRLKTETLNGGGLSAQQLITWAYDTAGIGNIQSRTDVGTYAYNASGANSVRPHAVARIAGTVNGLVNPTYSYDANGNLSGINATGGSRTVTWTSYNMVASVSQTVGANTNVLGFEYSPEHDRVRETYTKNGAVQRSIVYLNPGAGAGLMYEEEWNGANVVKRKYYLNAGDDTIGLFTFNGTAYTPQYWLKDHLGSPMVITDASGNMSERLAYEPFGKRRNANGTTDAAGTLTSANTQRGFTEHEMMDEVGLINMNGRIYDPAIGRFLSADASVPHPEDMQSYGRYTYVRNMPLSEVDPTGLFDTYGDCSICFGLYGSNSGPGGSLIIGGGVNINYGSGSSSYTPPPTQNSMPALTPAPAPITQVNLLGANSSVGQSFNQVQYSDSIWTSYNQPGKSGGYGLPTLSPFSLIAQYYFLPKVNALLNSCGPICTDFGYQISVAQQMGPAGAYGPDEALTAMAGVNFLTKQALGISRAAQGSGYSMGLGLFKDATTGERLLQPFARDLSVKTYGEISGTWFPSEQLITKAMRDANSLHVNLEGFSMKSFQEFAKSPGFRDGSITNWEVHTILNDSSLLNKATFYGPGRTIVPAPVIP